MSSVELSQSRRTLKQSPRRPRYPKLERISHAQLNLPLRERRRKSERCARRKVRAAVHVECRESRLESKHRAHHVIHARVVRVIRDVETLGRKLQGSVLAYSVLPAQPHVEVHIVRTEACVAIGANRTLVRSVVISVNFSARVQVERMSAVVLKNRRELKPLQDGLFPWAVDHRSHHHLMPLIKRRYSALKVQVRWILRTEVGVEIGACVDCLAVSVVREEREVVTQPLRHL